jgi:putative transposase
MEAHSFTAIGAISINKLWQLITKNASINKLNLSYLLKFFILQLWSISVVLMEKLRVHKLALIMPIIEAVGANIICLFHTLAYFNSLEKWLSQLISFSLWFAPSTTSMIDTIIAAALNKHESSTPKKLRKLRADNVFHNSRNCCNCYHTKSAKAKST